MPCALTASPEPREAVTGLDSRRSLLLIYLLTGLDSCKSLLLIYHVFTDWPQYALCSDSKSWTTRGCHTHMARFSWRFSVNILIDRPWFSQKSFVNICVHSLTSLCLVLWQQVLNHERLSQALILKIRDFYLSERLYLLRCLRHIVLYWDLDHPYRVSQKEVEYMSTSGKCFPSFDED